MTAPGQQISQGVHDSQAGREGKGSDKDKVEVMWRHVWPPVLRVDLASVRRHHRDLDSPLSLTRWAGDDRLIGAVHAGIRKAEPGLYYLLL